jgi:dihydrofolate reductase
MILSSIVAMSKNGVIGKDNHLPWKLPAESAYFRGTVKGHPVITGRRNWDSMGRPMPGCLNIVVTTQPDFKVPEPHIVVHSVEEALELPEVKEADEVFILGGQTIYEQTMDKIDLLYLTIVDAEVEGDTFFKYNPDEWKKIWSEKHEADEENKYAFELMKFERKK